MKKKMRTDSISELASGECITIIIQLINIVVSSVQDEAKMKKLVSLLETFDLIEDDNDGK